MHTHNIISIIVPVFNTEPYLKACVRSLQAQTCQEELEILLIDDGSCPDCAALCDTFEKEDQRIRVIHQRNTGLSGARNRGLDECNGDYILFVDSDDTISPDCCEKALAACREFNADAVIFLYQRTDASGNIDDGIRRGRTSFSMESRILSREEVMLSLFDNRIGNYAWNRLCRKELYQSIRFPEGRLYEDIGTTWKLMEAAENVYFLSRVLYHYFQHTGSISHVAAPKAIRDDFLMRESLWKYISGKYPSVSQGNEFFIIASALKYCSYTERAADPAVYDRAMSLLTNCSSVPEVFNSRQKAMIKLLSVSPELFHLVCRVFRKTRK